MADATLTPIEVGLTAAIVAVEADEPRILVAGDPKSVTRAIAWSTHSAYIGTVLARAARRSKRVTSAL